MSRLLTLSLLGLLLFPLPRLHAQASYTQLQPTDSGFGPLDKSTPAMPPDQIIQKFAAKESEFRQAMGQYTYTRSVKIETLNDDNQPDGAYQQVTDISYDGKGAKLEHVTFAPANTLERLIMTPADMSDIEHRLPFVLTTEDLPLYNITYVGRQKVDDLDTYVFDVAPKRIEKGQRYIQGRIWVEQRDLQIVVVNAKNVPDDLRPGHEDLSLPVHHLSRAGGWAVLVPRLQQGGWGSALLRGQRLHVGRRALALHREVQQLQALRHLHQDHLRGPGHHHQWPATGGGQNSRRPAPKPAPSPESQPARCTNSTTHMPAGAISHRRDMTDGA